MSKDTDKLGTVFIKCEERAAMTTGQALAWIGENINPATGHILVEMPERIIWSTADKLPNAEEIATCTEILAFDGEKEFRLEKEYGSDQGQRRIICKAPDGMKTLERRHTYLIAQHSGGGRVTYAEHFVEDEASGMYKPLLGRFCGVEDRR